MAPSPSVFLAAVAQRTKRLKFGPLVYTLPMYHPLRVAEEICMLDHLSNGRLQVGVGRGISPHELEHYGVVPAEAQARYLEAFSILLQVLTTGSVTFEGKFYSVPQRADGSRAAAAAASPAVVWRRQCRGGELGGAQRRQRRVQRAGRAGARDHGALLRRVDRGRKRIGGSPPRRHEPARGGSGYDRAGVEHRPTRLPSVAYELLQLWERHGTRPNYALYPGTFDELEAMGLGVAGSPEKVRDVLTAQAAEAGVNYLVCRLAFGDLALPESLRSLELYAGAVMPALASVREAAE